MNYRPDKRSTGTPRDGPLVPSAALPARSECRAPCRVDLRFRLVAALSRAPGIALCDLRPGGAARIRPGRLLPPGKQARQQTGRRRPLRTSRERLGSVETLALPGRKQASTHGPPARAVSSQRARRRVYRDARRSRPGKRASARPRQVLVPDRPERAFRGRQRVARLRREGGRTCVSFRAGPGAA